MPATSLMGYEVQVTGSNSGTWGDVLNASVIQFLDQNFAGINSFSLSSSTVTLTASQARNQMSRCTGVLLANIVITPDVAVLWNGIRCVENLTTGSFTVTLTYNAISVVIPQGRRALVFLDSSNGPRIVAIAGSSTADPVPAGSKTLWYNTAAPSGWTAVALNDYAIKIVTTGSGGVTSGSVAYSTLFGRTATDAHTLTTADTPSHQHFTVANATVAVGTLTSGNSISSGGNDGSSFNYTLGGSSSATLGLSSLTGSGGSHTHNIDMRVLTAAFTLATRD